MPNTRRLLSGLAAAAAVVLAAPAAASAIVLPDGFSEEIVAAGLTQATNIAFAPDGRMFVAEKAGRVRVVTADGRLQAAPVVDISAHVNTAVERGLLGIAVDSAFATNGYLWLLYDYEHDPGDFEGPKTARLSRVTVRADNSVADPADPETVVLGRDVAPCLPPAFVPGSTADCIPAHAITHTIGTVKSAPDGTLWVGMGDNSTHQDRVPSHLWTQRDDVLAGKILHVDRSGRGLAGHPFCPGEADLTKPCTKVFAKGLRNPFRFHLREGGGPIVGDVGWGAYEELNLVRPGGNYGWPCYEGPRKSPWEWDPACQPLYRQEGTNLAALAPDWSLPHGARPDPVDPSWTTDGASITGGPLMTSSNYPAAWRGRIFIGDYARRWMAALRIAGAAIDPAPARFALDVRGLVDLQLGPDGNLYYVSLAFGGATSTVRRIVFAPGNGLPVPRATATPTSGRAPLEVRFDGSASTDPEGEPLTYRWDFGDGATSDEVSPTHTYTVPGTYTARLSVDDGSGRHPEATVLIGVDNTAPRLSVTAPADGDTFRVGDRVRLRATWADDEETTFPGSRIRWEVNLHHRDHIHPRAELTGDDVEFLAIDDHGADSHYVVTATVTDPGGLSDRTTFELYPRTTPLRVASEPPGASLSFADATTTGFPPVPALAAPGFRTTISAQPEFLREGLRYRFAAWSDGGAATHSVTVPDADATYVARYRPATQGTATAAAARFVAEDGQANRVTIARHDGRHDLFDADHEVLAAGDCVRVEPNKASCPETAPLRAELGDGADALTILSDLGVAADGGPGPDTLTGGPGPDAFSGGDGDDAIVSRDGIAETVDCGAGADRVVADLEDRPAGCETVDVPFLAQSPLPTPEPPLPKQPLPAPERIAPRLAPPKRTATVRMDRRGRVRVRIGRLSEGARLRVDLRDTAGRRAARRRVTAKAGTVAAIRFRLDARARRLVRRQRRVAFRVVVTATDAAGNTSRRRLWVRVRR